MLGSLDSLDATLLIDDATNATYVEPGYLLYGRSGNLYAWRFDAARRRLIGQPVPIVQEKLSVWVPKGLAVFAASDSGTIVYLPEAVPRTALQWYDTSGRALGSLGKAGFYRTPRISPDGKKVAFALAESNPELRRPLDPGPSVRADDPPHAAERPLLGARLVPRFEPAGLRLPTQGSPGPLREVARRRGRHRAAPRVAKLEGLPQLDARRQVHRLLRAGPRPRSTTSTP